MCGINGLVGKNTDKENVLQNLQKMNLQILHRGPDEDGFFLEQNGDRTVGMAMRRLSIIDLSSGRQPIFSEDGTKVIVFNGEIYNYRELKADLINQGVEFSTHSDTEVILKLYEHYGVESFRMLDGMYAFSIYDKSLGVVFIARDYFGEKPLYYQHTSKGLIWASELKSIMSVVERKPSISEDGLRLYFQLTYIPAPFTIYDGIRKLEANTYIAYDITNNAVVLNSIHSDEVERTLSISLNEAKKTVKELVQESVLSRSVADVPLGTFLSGGVDSSIVSLCLAQSSQQKINTFSIGFEKKTFDETQKSREVAKLIGSNHREFIIGEKDLAIHTDDILLNFDEPFADSSALPSYIVARKTKEYVKVALTGDGGDEVFGGYNKYLIGGINSRYTNVVPEFVHKYILRLVSTLAKQKEDERGMRFKLRKVLSAIDYNNAFYYNIIKLGFSDVDIDRYLLNDGIEDNVFQYYQRRLNTSNTLTDFRMIDKMISLEGDMITKVDRTSMLASLECRAPFLNKRLWDYTNSLPEHLLLNGSNKKYILKKAFEDQFPHRFLEKTKQGFGVPVGDWLRNGMRVELLSYIDRGFLMKQNIFNVDGITSMVQNHINSVEDNSFKVWTFFCFQKWYKYNYEE